MRLLQVLPSADPRAGGTAESVRQLSVHLQTLGHSVTVVTVDLPTQSFVAEYPLRLAALGPSFGTYRYCRGLIPWLKANVCNYDAVIVNGIWQYHSFAVWRVMRESKIPYVVFPHGMLDPWFKHTYRFKHIKKWMYWPWAEYRVLRDARVVLFTSEEEQLLARQSFWLYRANERVVTFGTGAPPLNSSDAVAAFAAAYPDLQARRVLLFMSRIHEKKGCDLLIEAFASVATRDASLHLMVAGPDQSGLATRLRDLARQLGISDRISWPGMLQGAMKWGALYSAEAFILPSHQENFGIVVAEALACGLPVLISDKVNIWREIKADGAGFVAPDTLEGTIRNLEEWLKLDARRRRDMAYRAATTFRERFTVNAMAGSVLSVLEDIA